MRVLSPGTRWASLGAAGAMAHALAWRSWSLGLGPSPQHFLMLEPLPPMALLTLGLWMLLLTGLIWRLLDRPAPPGRAVALIWAALTVYLLASFGKELGPRVLPLVRTWPAGAKLLLLPAAGLILLGAIGWIGVARWFRGSTSLMRLLWPLPLLLWGQLALHPRAWEAPFPAPFRVRTRPHPTWILIFDELDYRLSLGEGSGRAPLPELRGLQAQSLSLTRATPPAQLTPAVISSLWLGRTISGTVPIDARTLRLRPGPDEGTFLWSGEGSLFHVLDRRGRSLAADGWFLPYDRLLRGTSAQVRTEPMAEEAARLDVYRGFATSLLAHALDALPIPGTPTRTWLVHREQVREQHRQAVLRFESRIATIADAPLHDYHWLHLPLPHDPPLAPGGSYLDNLAAADRLLGIFRRTLEARGLWEDSTILLLGDHGFRQPDQKATEAEPGWVTPVQDRWATPDDRVPFLIKLPGQAQGIRFQEPVNTTLLRDLVLTLDEGGLRRPEDLEGWLETHHQAFPPVHPRP